MRKSAPHSSPSSLGEGDRRRWWRGRTSPNRGGGPPAGWWRGLTLSATTALAACTQTPAQPAANHAPTIVSLNPCSDAILAEVTAPGQLRAISHYSADPRASSMDPATARQYPSTRGTLEEVIALRPDVVVDGTFVAPATAAAYRRLGITLEALPIASTVEQSHAQIRRLAALAGNPQRGEALIQRIDFALKAATPSPHAAPVQALVWQPGGIVPGDGTLIADLLRRTGFANFAAARGLGQADQLPLEHVLAAPPRVILAAGGDRALTHTALARLKSTTRAPLNPALLYCAGPTIIRAAARLAEVRRALEKPTPNPSRTRDGGRVALTSPLPLAARALLISPLPLAARSPLISPLPLAARSPLISPLPLAGGVGGGQAAKHNP